MMLVTLCAAALAGLGVADVWPLAVMPLLLASTLSAIAAWLAPPRGVSRTLALLLCAVSLGAARASVGGNSLPALNQVGATAETVTAALAPMRNAARDNIASYLPQPQAALATGVLLGGSAQLDSAFKADLRRSGLAHLVAIDGFKQVIVAAIVGALATRLVGPRLAVPPSLAIVVGYTLLTGAHPSAVRAALMVSLARLASLSGRIADPLTSLGLALLGMALVEPRVLLDVGLQLSLSATLGIVLLWPTLRRRLRLYRLPRLLAEPIGLSLAVGVACLPLTLAVFGLVSLASPLAHVLAVPLLPAQLLASVLLAIAAPLPQLAAAAAWPAGPTWLVSSLVNAVAWLAWLPTSLLVAVVRGFGSLPGASITTGRLSLLVAGARGAGLLGWGIWQLPELRETRLVWRGWLRRHREALRPIACTFAALAAAMTLQVLRPDGRLHVEPLGVARGDALFVRGPTGNTAVVVLGRADPAALAGQVAARMAIWEHRLDAVIVLDAPARAAVGPLLAEYPPLQLIAAHAATERVGLAIGGNQTLAVAARAGRISVEADQAEARSDLTTSAARPGSAN